MKKARLLLSAVVVFAVVGSSLAFKTFKPRTLFGLDETNQCVAIQCHTDGTDGAIPCPQAAFANIAPNGKDCENPVSPAYLAVQ